MTVQRYFDHASNRFIEVVSLFDGKGGLPWQDDADPAWRNSGSFRELTKRGGNHKEFLTANEVKGKAAGKAWNTRKTRRQGAPAAPLTDGQIEGVKLEWRRLSLSALAKKYDMPRSRARQLVRRETKR